MKSDSYDKIEKVKRQLFVKRPNLGKAGEYLVAGKLLLNGFNVYSAAIDDGIDLVAKKKRKFYYIQVKSCQDTGYDTGKFMANINLTTLSKFPTNQTFLVLVLHYLGPTASVDFMGDHNRYDQEYIVLPIKVVEEFIGRTEGNVTVYIYNSLTMPSPRKKDEIWIMKLRYGGKDLILDDFLFDSFWQIEV